jgi:hypothetical protein
VSSSIDTLPCALVTGASSGIGRAYARALHARGERVLLVARRLDRLQELSNELGGAQQARALALDVTDPDALARLEAELAAARWHVALLINNAGAGDTGRFSEQDAARLRQIVELNVQSLMALTRHVLPGMLARHQGAIVNVVSNGAFQPVPFLTVYAATKSFVLSFSEGLSEELRGSGVQVQALCPGLTDTEFFEVARTDSDLWVNRLPRLTPEAVVRASLRGLARRRVRVIPGLGDRVMAAAVPFVPGSWVRRIAASLYRPC